MKLYLIICMCMVGLFASKLEVTTSIVPQKYFIEKIAKDKVIVNVMVKENFSPATYEPKTSQMKKLSNSKAYFSIGVPFEHSWLPKFKSANKKMLIVDTTAGIQKLEMSKHEHHEDEHDEDKHEEHSKHEAKKESHDDHDHEDGLDPHIWLDPILVKVQVKNILDALIVLDNKNRHFYTKNYEEFAAELDLLNSEIKDILSNNSKSAFMVFHPSWNYFAKRYDLIQIAVEKEGKEPKPKELIELIEEAKEHGIKIVFVSPQFSKKSAKLIAKSINGNVISINHLSHDYKKNLIDVAYEIQKSYK